MSVASTFVLSLPVEACIKGAAPAALRSFVCLLASDQQLLLKELLLFLTIKKEKYFVLSCTLVALYSSFGDHFGTCLWTPVWHFIVVIIAPLPCQSYA